MTDFTFQINNDVKWQYNNYFLDKAKNNKPVLQRAIVKPSRLVDIVADKTKFNGWSAQNDSRDLLKLDTYALGRNDSVILDFGNHHVGYFKVDIQHVGSPMDAPTYLHIKFAELPAELMGNSDEYDGWLSKSWIAEEYIHLDVVPTTLVLPRRYAFRYVQISVIDTSAKYKITLANPELTAVSAVLNKKVLKPLVLDDPVLQKIDDVSQKTLQDSMQDVYEDGPKRDHRLWLGDLRLQALANYATFDDRQLVKRSLYLFAGMPTTDGRLAANVFTEPEIVADDTFLFDYSLFFVSTLHDYYQHTKDVEVRNDLYDTAKKAIDVGLSFVNSAGVLSLDNRYPVFVEWSNTIDKTAAAQAILIYALKQFITLSEAQKLPVETYKNQLKQLIDAAKIYYFDAKEGLFVSGPERQINIASQVWMVLAGVLNSEQNYELMAKSKIKLFPIKGIATPYMYHHVVEALFIAGHQTDAIQLIKDYWGGMIALGADTFWEAFDPNQPDFSPYGSVMVNSYSHAWSCTPSYLLRKYVMKLAV